jgi:hypothetical protein
MGYPCDRVHANLQQCVISNEAAQISSLRSLLPLVRCWKRLSQAESVLSILQGDESIACLPLKVSICLRECVLQFWVESVLPELSVSSLLIAQGN